MMTTQPLAAPSTAIDATDSARLNVRWLTLARAAWYIAAASAFGLLLLSLSNYIALVGVVTEQEQSIAKLINAPALFSPSRDFEFWVDAVFNTLSFAAAAMCLLLAVLIFRRRSNERMPYVVSLTLLVFGIVMAGPLEMLVGQRVAGETVALFGQMLLWGFILFLLCIFPDGRFVPRWTRWFALLLAPWAISLAFWQPLNMDTATLFPFLILYTLPSLVPPLAQIYRYRRVSNAMQRQQTQWVIFGFTTWIVAGTGLTGSLLYVAINFLAPANPTPTVWTSLFVFVARLVWPLSLFVLPLTLTIAVMRDHLFDIDVILKRALVYGALTALFVVIYILVVGSLSALFQTSGNLFISLLATGIVAILFQPLRERMQRGVNRLLYGERDEPYAALSKLGQRLESTLAPDAVLPALVETVAQALRLPYAAIRLDHKLVASYPPSSPVTRPVSLVTLPLVYQNETYGELVVAPREPGENFSSADWRLLNDFARQAGIAAHAVQLTNALQHSRERLVNAREEERRRIRRDLHDGLGPALAAQTLKVGTARALMRSNPAQADALLGELERDIQNALADIRRLVYDLRPPALDELGLVGAIRESALQYRADSDNSSRLNINVTAPDKLPPLPAAVEVAAYRIVQEALTNVLRHAHARNCDIELTLNGSLRINISDDGIGLPATRHFGVGLNSMRERAAELGGACVIEPNDARGTRVSVDLPPRVTDNL